MFGPGDGCTLWFDGVWRHCCDAHDLAYSFDYAAMSGTLEAVPADQLSADFALGLCVAQTGHVGMGIIMLIGVRLFGWIFYKRR